VILHQGNIEQGHYFAFAESNDGSWWKYNDEQVSMIDIRQQLNLSLNMEKIYIMMYERTTP
jgi:ubiquitin C-terminal hydrolase